MLNHSMNLCGILCSWGLMESSAKNFSICCHTGPVGMTKILSPCPCPELCIPAGTGDALILQLLGWAPDPQVLFNTPPFLTGFILWMDELLTIPIPHLERIYFFHLTVHLFASQSGWTYLGMDSGLKYMPVYCPPLDSAFTAGWRIIFCEFVPCMVC